MNNTRSRARRVLVLFSAATVASAVLIAGCKVDQSAEVATYRRVLDASPTTAPAAPLAPDEPVSLRKALTLANDHNESLSINGESYLQALIAKRRAVAAFIPTVTGSASYNISSTGQNSNTFAVGSGSRTSLQAGLSEQVNLFNGFQDISNVRRAEYVIEQRRWQLLDLQNSVLLDVANTYYRTLISERSVDVLRDTVTLQNQRITDQTARFNQGIAKRLDVLQSEADAANTRTDLTRAINDVHNGRATLANVIGVPYVEGPLSDDLPDPPADFDLNALIRDAMATRQDLQAAHAAIEAARQSVKIAVGQYYPSLNLNLSQTLYRNPSSPTNWAANLPVTIPIFTAGVIEQDVRLAWSQFRQSALTEMQLERQVLEDVRIAYANMQSSAAQLRDIRYGVDAAENAYFLAQRSYNAGTATNLDVLTAQNQMLNARLQLVTEQLNYKLFYLQLLRAQGRLFIPNVPPTPPPTPTTTAPTTMPVAQ
jgi:outer membrane protein